MADVERKEDLEQIPETSSYYTRVINVLSRTANALSTGCVLEEVQGRATESTIGIWPNKWEPAIHLLITQLEHLLSASLSTIEQKRWQVCCT